MRFFYIYKSLAHPENNGYVAPLTLQERLLHVAEAKQKLGSRITWLCDTMKNDAKHALGDAPNSEFLVGPDGKLLQVRRWSSPSDLRKDLEAIFGEVTQPTTIADVGMRPLEPPRTAPKGVVPRLALPGRMTPVHVALANESPFAPFAAADVGVSAEPTYAKLRAEIDSQYLQSGEGKLYLGLFLDPLYQVHWNNQVAPVAYEIQTPQGVQVSPPQGKGPSVKEPADADPREFLLEVSGRSREPIQVTVKYFACDDAETFCKPVTQRYLVTLERDRDGGSRRTASRRGPGRGRPRNVVSANSSQQSRSLRLAVEWFGKYDHDQDGRLGRGEWRRVEDAPPNADANRDGAVSLRELIDALEARPSSPTADGASNPRRARPRPPSIAAMFSRMDADGDGKLTRSEVPAALRQRWERLDVNGDDVLDEKELEQVAARRRRR